MTNKSIQLIVFFALLVHGIGHFQGVVASLGVKINKASELSSWALTSISSSSQKTVALILFLIAGLAGIGAALGFRELITIGISWQNLALVSAFASSLCLILFPGGFAMFFNKMGAIAINLIIFYSILLANNWPTAAFDN